MTEHKLLYEGHDPDYLIDRCDDFLRQISAKYDDHRTLQWHLPDEMAVEIGRLIEQAGEE